MRRFLTILFSLAAPILLSAQAQIDTKKFKIEDFTEKTTKIVMSGNPFLDEALKEEVSSRWRISPFEFCTLQDFETLKNDDNYYFLLSTKGQFRRETEPGLMFLTVVKGGKGADKSIDKMLEVVSTPISAVKNPSGREFVFLPAILDIIQDHIVKSMEKDVNAYAGLGNYTLNISNSNNKTILFAEEDLAAEVTDKARNLYFKKNIVLSDEDTADEAMMDHKENTIVSFTVCAGSDDIGSYCYKMLIDAQTHQLYYYRRHRITKKFGSGFLIEDLNRIATSR